MRFWLLLLLITSTSLADAPATQPRANVPPVAEQQAAGKRVEEIFHDDIGRAKSPEEKVALSRTMVMTALEEKNDSAGRLALLALASNTAAEAGDLGGACRAIDEMDRLYVIDAMKLRADVATRVSKLTRPVDEKKRLVEDVDQLLTQALDADRFDAARQLADVEAALARTLDDPNLAKQAQGRNLAIKDREAGLPGFRKAMAVLDEKPTDADANLEAGRYRCFVRGDWENGLAMLALGTDAKIKRVAQLELKTSPESNAPLTIADGWFDVAANESGVSKEQVLQHSAKWYRTALPELSGLHKAKAELRLAGISPAVMPTTRPLVAGNTGVKPVATTKPVAAGNGRPHPDDAVQSKNGHWFKLVSEMANWEEAKAQCEKLGGHLACLENAEEQETVARIVADSKHRWVWIGGRTSVPKGPYVWVNGKPIGYSNWAKGEPNGASGKESVIYMGKSSGNWFDADASRSMAFVCEWER